MTFHPGLHIHILSSMCLITAIVGNRWSTEELLWLFSFFCVFALHNPTLSQVSRLPRKSLLEISNGCEIHRIATCSQVGSWQQTWDFPCVYLSRKRLQKDEQVKSGYSMALPQWGESKMYKLKVGDTKILRLGPSCSTSPKWKAFQLRKTQKQEATRQIFVEDSDMVQKCQTRSHLLSLEICRREISVLNPKIMVCVPCSN